ncbi:peptide chain release factor 1 [Oxynema aestuarii]|uniref:Peptide chain release factor 1 n=1 Tax=Oxynema aestuarii AP17 TaxID=2064643 RepID=A0A6H1U269_9CYAN|nr:peptide chain release factor 1 [Oxynema aestuarii]QIZ72467.1 peptide chain release factor 1 [Oxynema aestuarii AP17]
MSSPFQSLKQLPWRSLLQVAAVATVALAALDFTLFWVAAVSASFRHSLELLFAPPLGLAIALSVAVGFGAFGVLLGEQCYAPSFFNRSTLWALVFCLLLGVGVKSLLPLPSLLLSLSRLSLIGISLGVFWKGRPYWR